MHYGHIAFDKGASICEEPTYDCGETLQFCYVIPGGKTWVKQMLLGGLSLFDDILEDDMRTKMTEGEDGPEREEMVVREIWSEKGGPPDEDRLDLSVSIIMSININWWKTAKPWCHVCRITFCQGEKSKKICCT